MRFVSSGNLSARLKDMVFKPLTLCVFGILLGRYLILRGIKIMSEGTVPGFIKSSRALKKAAVPKGTS